MAVYHLSVKPVRRSKGHSAVSKAAYRAAEKLYDKRLGQTFDYEKKNDVFHKEIITPKSAPEWMRSREELWNYVEHIEKRKDSRTAIEIEVSLPRELSYEENKKLVKEFVNTNLVSIGIVADVCLHKGHGEDQPHAHILYTTRGLVNGGFGKKIDELYKRRFIYKIRESWANIANKHLALTGHDIRIDHRSYKDQGIDLKPQKKLGPKAIYSKTSDKVKEHEEIARENGEKIYENPKIVLEALISQQSTFSMHDLARFVNRNTLDAEQFTKVFEKVKLHPELAVVGKDAKGEERYTTIDMLEVEHRMISQAMAKLESSDHIVDLANHTKALGLYDLSREQKLAYNHITDDKDIALVVGYAGTGKSYMLGAAKVAWESEGYNVIGMALSGIAADQLEGGAGIKSYTIANRLTNWENGMCKLDSHDIVVVDEAGMVGSRDLAKIMDEVTRSGAKAVFVGDPEQLQAIQAGAALRGLVERIGCVVIEEIRRQKYEWQKEATVEFATARTKDALDSYNRRGFITEHETQSIVMEELVNDWNESRVHAPEKSSIILAYKRSEVMELNRLARDWRVKRGELGEGKEITTSRGKKEFAVNDRIYFLKNDRDLGVKNGNLGTIVSIEDNEITVKVDGSSNKASKVITFNTSDYDEIDHDYAATVHKSQGVTVDRTYILASTLFDRHSTYVAFTRARESTELYWSKESFKSYKQLKFYMSRIKQKDLTVDYAPIVKRFNRVRGIKSEISENALSAVEFRDHLVKMGAYAHLPSMLAGELKELKEALDCEVDFDPKGKISGKYIGGIKLGGEDYSVVEQGGTKPRAVLIKGEKLGNIKNQDEIRIGEHIGIDGKKKYKLLSEPEFSSEYIKNKNATNAYNAAAYFVDKAARKFSKGESYKLYNKLPYALPEFGFVRRCNCLVSTTGHKVDGSEGKKGKVYVYDNNPGVIVDYTRGSKSVWDYVSEQVLPHGKKHEVFEYLMGLAGLKSEFSQRLEPLKKIMKTAELKVVEEVKQKVSSELWQEVQDFALEKISIKNNQVVKYLEGAHGYNKDMIKEMGVGYIPSKKELASYLKAKDISEEKVKEVIIALGYIGRQNKMTVPYYDEEGKILGFVGRNIRYTEQSEVGKYVYSKGMARNNVLFNIHLAKQNRPLVVVEGMLDALHAKAKGIENVVALGGVSMSIRQAELIKRLNVKEVILCLDNDKAGVEGAKRTAMLLDDKVKDITIKSVSLPSESKDVDELLKNQSSKALQSAITNAQAIDMRNLRSQQEQERNIIIKPEKAQDLNLGR